MGLGFCEILKGKTHDSDIFRRPKEQQQMNSADRFLEATIQEARQGLLEGGIPIGSVIVHGDAIIGRGDNRRVQKRSAILHGDGCSRERRPPARLCLPGVYYLYHALTVLHVLGDYSPVRNSPRDRRREPDLHGGGRASALPRGVG